MSDLRFDGRVAIVTGAGNGLGRSHALLLASRGCKVVVNDLGGGAKGEGKSSSAADKVVEEIKAAGGEAVANYDSVEDGAKIVQTAMDTWKRIDIIINNAGILRDTSFKKLTQEDWDLIYRVHVLGGFRVTKAAWDYMQDAGYGRIIFTASAAGIYGNFGQANYSMAKLGLLGLSNTLAIEGKKKNVLVNTIAPIAGSRLTETVLPKNITDALKPEYVSPLVAWLVNEKCDETGGLFEVGGGLFTKLRWERTEGKLFKLGRDIKPEQIKSAWGQITSFEKATHPSNINESMGPILGNLESKALGGNDFIDVDTALGYEFPPQKSSYDEKDLSLYALGVGAGQNPLDAGELQYVYENAGDGFKALPTFGVVPALGMVFEMYKRGETAPGMNYGFDRILHGEQYTELKRPLPTSAKLTHKAKIKDIWDKGKGAVVVTAITTLDEDGNELVYNELSTFVRGAGGWGGERGPSAEINVAPDRKPDAVVEEKISESQALLYRLSGDINPLHADPGFAKAFGFDKPILHGLCTFGFAARHVIKAFSKNDPRFFKSIKVRFSESVFPGETLMTEMWKEGDKIVFRCKVKERDKVVISNAAVELYKEIPKAPEKKKAAAAPAAAGAAARSGEPTSAEAFAVIGDFIAQNGSLASEVGKTFLFKLSSPDSAWTIDLKNGKGGVSAGGSAGDCILELSDADFCAMVAGKADPMKLWTEKKLKIGGDVMASQKLMFLKKIDPKRAMEVVAQLRATGEGVPAGGAPKAAAASGEATSAEAFAVIGDFIAQNGSLASEVGKTFLFKLSSPDSAWTVDLKNGKGSVASGGTTADCILDLSDADFCAMVAGKADPMKLWTEKKLKISGDVMASQKLMFLKKIDPKRAMEVVAKLRGAGGPSSPSAAAAPAGAAAAPAKATQAPAILKALGERFAKTPNLAKEVGATVNLLIGDSAWTLDLTGNGEIKEGRAKADAALTMSDDDLVALAKGENLRDLYQHGRIRIDGDTRVAHKLSFFKGLV